MRCAQKSEDHPKLTNIMNIEANISDLPLVQQMKQC